ncbi:stage III sporulation protein AG [Paenibacillus swuensis]|uniref:Stage III sporulation protein AG n=1 Tax=Paenibacillus swuensis TaxID=1178515 RepID=A0A172TME2_9BACL|nr:stage III sporulation protein AG [Paenibacillus swuensis]ANE48074.1 stage III sporulation protein AG [Paenibacillus swuensis]
MGKFTELLEKWTGGGPGGGKRTQTIRWIVLLGLTGAALMIINSFVSVKEIADPLSDSRGSPEQNAEPAFGAAKEDTEFDEYERKYETKIREILDKMIGVGAVDVLVTIDSTEELVIKQNTKSTQQVTDENDQNGGRRHVTDVDQSSDVVLHEKSGDQVPIVVKKMKPQVRGVLIVARGAENAAVKRLIKEAVERGLSVPAHRISVVPRKQ